MDQNNFFHVIIIGNGPAGCSAATYISRGNYKTLMFTGPIWGGHLVTTTTVYNYIGYVEIDGLKLMETMTQQAKSSGTTIKETIVKTVIFKTKKIKKHQIMTVNNEIYYSDVLIIATGAQHKHLDLPKSTELKNNGIYYCATCDGSLFRYDMNPVIVVGGGNTALTEALYLSGICKKVIVVHRRNTFRGEQFLINQILKKPNIDIQWDSEICQLIGKKTLEAIEIYNNKTKIKTTIITSAVFVAIGFFPNTDIFKNTKLKLQNGAYIKVNNKQQTNIKDVYAVGDVCDFNYRQAITAAGDGAKAAINILKDFNLIQ
jgi:thioredoxin reductase (NADPH)